ncbi:polyamine ABC transporter substrate-binding protein [Chondromyces apiculatus]|uniref:ABC transporter, periplasmic spermidine putrescine-binding protein PotD n=1 Tax=Chondromyces apiculatus DSM 436 TaxID=1192034 RepID=A0A017T9N1_9BACT|nr:spermidine/putrescine ABC transporter substrate-binding protein [Chondromyces apiculatus]EYF05978.1 ABC transporter, periplasmic spermidine putrescine-binding protein PotD [Chondromyces apiculatus DSM 436]
MKRIGGLIYLLAIAIVAFLVGCKKDEPAAPAPGAGSAKAPAAAAVGKELNLFAWSEYIPEDVITGFTKETGVKVNYETYASNEEMLSKLLAGGTKYDLIQPSEYVIEALVKQNKLEALDHAKLTNLKNIVADLRDMPHDPGLKYSVPWMVGFVGIVVNTDKVKDPVKGFKDVFQDKYKGRIVALNDNREIVAWAMMTHGIDVNQMTPENLEKVKPTVEKWIKLVKVFDSDSPKTAMMNGDVDIGVVWSGEGAILANTDKKYAFVIPEEGARQYIDNLAIPKGAPNAEGAHLFINYILRPEVSKLVSDKFPYTNPNSEARKLLTPEQLKNPASYPEIKSKQTFRDIGKAASDLDKMVTDLKAAAN